MCLPRSVLTPQCLNFLHRGMEEVSRSLFFMKLVNKNSCLHLKQVFIFLPENTYIALESVVVPGQHVGVSENGEVCLPGKTPPLDPASLFVPFLHSAAVGGQNLPAGWQAMKTPDGKEYFINHITKITSWTLPGENPTPSSNTASHRDRGVASGPDTEPTTTAAAPKGYDLMVRSVWSSIIQTLVDCLAASGSEWRF